MSEDKKVVNLLSDLSAALDNINPPRVKTTGDKDALNAEIHILLALVTDKIQRKYHLSHNWLIFNLIYAGLLPASSSCHNVSSPDRAKRNE